jgi:hypothetical protein
MLAAFRNLGGIFMVNCEINESVESGQCVCHSRISRFGINEIHSTDKALVYSTRFKVQ